MCCSDAPQNLIPLIFISGEVSDQAFPLLRSVVVRCIFINGSHISFGYPETIGRPSVDNSRFSVVSVRIVCASAVVFFVFSLPWCDSKMSPKFGVVQISFVPVRCSSLLLSVRCSCGVGPASLCYSKFGRTLDTSVDRFLSGMLLCCPGGVVAYV